jgi:hypothetical protein
MEETKSQQTFLATRPPAAVNKGPGGGDNLTFHDCVADRDGDKAAEDGFWPWRPRHLAHVRFAGKWGRERWWWATEASDDNALSAAAQVLFCATSGKRKPDDDTLGPKARDGRLSGWCVLLSEDLCKECGTDMQKMVCGLEKAENKGCAAMTNNVA